MKLSEPLIKYCKICNQPFNNNDLRKKYCSEKCAEKAKKRQIKKNNSKYQNNGYFEKYYKKNRAKILENKRNYYLTHIEQIHKQQKEYRQKQKLL